MFALCDQRSFYASCEGVFRPEIRHQPICVLSNNDGCVVALNSYAKSAGVQKFLPYFQQRQLIQHEKVHVFSSNYALYGNISSRIMATLRQLTPAVEVYSIDEGFCDLSQIPLSELKPLGQRLRDTIWREQRIPMGVSIAPTKTLAKLGQYATKHIPRIDGVAVLSQPYQWEWLAKRVPIHEVWGVGRRLSEALMAIDVHSAYDLSQLDQDVARKIGGIPLYRTVLELSGESCIPMEQAPAAKQQIICSRSLGQKLRQLDPLLEAVGAYACRAAEKLRSQECMAGRLSVWLTNKHRSFSLAINIPSGSNDSRLLAARATRLACELFQPGTQYIKAGVALMDIRPTQFWQPDLLSNNTGSEALMPVIDGINRKYGRETVMLGRQAGSAKFAMKQQLLSPRYLSHWQDLPSLTC